MCLDTLSLAVGAVKQQTLCDIIDQDRLVLRVIMYLCFWSCLCFLMYQMWSCCLTCLPPELLEAIPTMTA